MLSEMNSFDIITQIRLILVWYWSDMPDSEYGMIRAIRLTPYLVANNYKKFNDGDWWVFFDALGSYPTRSDLVSKFYTIVREKWMAI